METLLYVAGFIIGVLGTWFLLYFLKTRKTLRVQNELIHLLLLGHIAEDLKGKDEKCKKPCEGKKPQEEKPQEEKEE